MDETQLLFKRGLLYGELSEFRKAYSEDVLPHFSNANKVRGNAAFTSWEERFLIFLESALPTKVNDYHKHLSSNSKSAMLMMTVLQSWKVMRGDAVESFLDQIIEEARDGHFDNNLMSQPKKEIISETNRYFVDPVRIVELESLETTRFDISRLAQMCKELNICFSQRCYYATAMLTRSILDHVPPIFNMGSFEEIANNYSGTKSFKASMLHLGKSSRAIADASLHTQIRNKETLLTATQVNFSNDLDVLLAEIVRLLK